MLLPEPNRRLGPSKSAATKTRPTGGAIRGNAGAMGKEIKNILTWVEVWRDGEVIRLRPEECGFSYRNSDFKTFRN